jgi:hypothetical protein
VGPERDKGRMNSGLPVEVLERRAAEQRQQLHQSVIELKDSVRERLDVKRNMRDHLWGVSGGLAVVGLVLGYSVAGIFTRD